MKASVFKKIGRYLKIFLIIKKIGFIMRASYKLNFYLLIFAVFFQMFLTLIFFHTIFRFTQNISGWSYFELLIVVGSYMIVEGLIWMLFGQLGGLRDMIRRGSLDTLLVKPVDTQFLISFWRGDIEDISRLATGLIVIVYAVKNLGFDLEKIIIGGFFYFLMLVSGTVIAYSIGLMFQSLNFWLIRGFSLFIIQDSIISMSRFPVEIFTNKFFRLFFTFVAPVAFISTFPARIFIHGFQWKLVLGSFTLAVIFFWLSRKFWLFSLKHYCSAGG